MPRPLRLVETPPVASFSDGYIAGPTDGQRMASERLLWLGIGIGACVAALIAWAVL